LNILSLLVVAVRKHRAALTVAVVALVAIAVQ
jgi:hypothetical protein